MIRARTEIPAGSKALALGQKRVATNLQGQASFSFETTKPLNTGDQITATATSPGGNTSEFSTLIASP